MMKIAIKGHISRGKEIIQILESLGGKNLHIMTGSTPDCAYYINSCYKIDANPLEYVKQVYQVYTLEEFEKEFPFKVGDIVLLKGVNKPYEVIALEWYMNKLCYKLDSGLHYAPETLTTYKEMKEERNITLTLDKAKEWYSKGGELKEIALQAFTEKELNPLPRSWEEYCEKYPVKKGECWIGTQDTVYVATNTQQDRLYKNWIQSKKSAEAHLAMMQLEQLRDCWRQDWKPTRNNTGHCITHYPEGYSIMSFCFISFLSFPTRKMAEEFLECFRDLIEKAGDLI